MDAAALSGEFSDIAVDAAGTVHVSCTVYYGGFKYARRENGAWTTALIDPTPSRYTSIALDPGGKVHISYVSAGLLKYATKNASGDWEITSIDRSGLDTVDYYAYASSIALDLTGAIHISYFGEGRVLKHAVRH